MKNYYEEKFEQLVLEFGLEKAKEKIVKELLYKSSQPKIGNYKNKYDMFWQSNFINSHSVEDVSSENYIIALSQYLRFGGVDKKICINYLKLDVQSFILAIRQSGLILQSDHNSWEVFKEINQEIKSEELDNFFETINYLQSQYKHRLEIYEDIKNMLNIGQITAMAFGSLYAYQYLIPNQEYYLHLPYQFDSNENNSAETVWKAFDHIVKTSKKNTKKLTEKSIGLALRNKLIPFLLGDGMNQPLQDQYEFYKKLVAIRIEILNYKRNVLESFSFDNQVNYKLNNSELMYSNTKDKKDNWSEKNALLLNYWLSIGVEKLLESDVIYSILNTGDNLEANAIALSKAFGIQEQLAHVYGITEFSINHQKLNAFETMITMTLSQAHYLKDHIDVFESLLVDSSSNLEAIKRLMIHGFMIGQNRMPFTFSKRDEKVKKMSSWIKDDSNNIKKKKMDEILSFWSCDLYDAEDVSTFQQKPFYKIDDFIFQFPWLTAYQNLNTSMINYFRKLHKNRFELKGETSQLESTLAEKLLDLGFKVFPQFIPEFKDVGEVDLIAIYGNHVIVAEVKSTYIRSSTQEIHEYKNFTLNKASYQLDKKVEYIKKYFLKEHFSDLSEVVLHTWIIDTTLEFDHEYIGDYLKVSLDEIIISLNGHKDFMDSFVNTEFYLKKSIDQVDPIQFLESIENNLFWNKQIRDYDDNLQGIFQKLSSKM